MGRSQWHITENVHEPIIDLAGFENVQRILENAPVKHPNGNREIHPLSGLLFCKDCGAKMHIRIDYRNGGKRHVAYCSEYRRGKAKNPKCHSPHIIDADLLMQTVADVLKKIADYSIRNRADFEALVKKILAMRQTDRTGNPTNVGGKRRSENRGDESAFAATESVYLQTTKLAERGTGKRRAAHPCRRHSEYLIAQGTGRKIGIFSIAL